MYPLHCICLEQIIQILVWYTFSGSCWGQYTRNGETCLMIYTYSVLLWLTNHGWFWWLSLLTHICFTRPQGVMKFYGTGESRISQYAEKWSWKIWVNRSTPNHNKTQRTANGVRNSWDGLNNKGTYAIITHTLPPPPPQKKKKKKNIYIYIFHIFPEISCNRGDFCNIQRTQTFICSIYRRGYSNFNGI